MTDNDFKIVNISVNKIIDALRDIKDVNFFNDKEMDLICDTFHNTITNTLNRYDKSRNSKRKG